MAAKIIGGVLALGGVVGITFLVLLAREMMAYIDDIYWQNGDPDEGGEGTDEAE